MSDLTDEVDVDSPAPHGYTVEDRLDPATKELLERLTNGAPKE